MKKIVGIIGFALISLVTLRFAPSSRAAFYSYNTDTTTVTRGEQFDINVHLDTESIDTNAVDFVGGFDTALFTLDSVQFNTLYQDTFETIDANTGMVSLAGSAGSMDQGFNGADTLATLTVTPHTTGTSDFTIDCDQSAVWRSPEHVEGQKGGTGTNVLDCGKLGHLTITVTDIGVPAPTQIPSGGSCTAFAPPAPFNVRAESGPANGQITLFWDAVTPVTHYGINYGTSPGFYSIGATNVGKFPQFTVSNLVPSTSYYFTIYAVNDCAISPISLEVSNRAAASTIPGVDLTPEVIFVPLENQAGSPKFDEPKDSIASATATPAAVVEDEDESLLANSNPLFILLAAGGVVFLIALYLIGKNRNGPKTPQFNAPLEPHHADPVEKHSSEPVKKPSLEPREVAQFPSKDIKEHLDTPLHQSIPKEGA